MVSINHHQLHVFYAVAREGSFSRGAQALGISQPATSIQVRELEAALGAQLCYRQRHGIRLTDLGELVYDYAHRILSLSRELETAVDDTLGLRRGVMTIGASSTPGEYLLPRVIGAFKAQYPGLQFSLRISNTATVMQQVLRREVDLGVVGDALPSPETKLEPFADDEIVIVAAADSAIAAKQSISLEDVAAEGFVVRERGSATRRIAEEALAALGVHLTVNMELGGNEAVKGAVAAGLGLGLISHYGITAEERAGMLVRLPVEGWKCVRPLYLVQRKDKHETRAEREFIDLLLGARKAQ